MRLRRLSLLLLAVGCGQLPVDDAGIDGSPDVTIEDASMQDAGAGDVDGNAPEAAQNDVSTDSSSDAVTDSTIDVSEGGVTTTTLVVNQNTIVDIAIDSTNVYWTSGKLVSSCALGGCSQQPTVLVTDSNFTAEIATDSVNVYFQGYGVESCAVGGCSSPTQLSEGGYGMATDGVDVFYGVVGNPGLAKCDVGGCSNPPPRLIYGGNYNQFAVDSTNVYWTNRFNGSEVFLCAKAGCNGTGTLLADGQGGVNGPQGIAIDATNVYWTNTGNGTIQSCAITGCNDKPTTLATQQNNPVDIATDGAFVYWVEQGAGTVRKCAVTGCSNSPATLASNLSNPVAIEVDSTSVYFAASGSITKLTPK
jgi:hypothetical protein